MRIVEDKGGQLQFDIPEESTLEELKAEVIEANENATWWQNRYNAKRNMWEELKTWVAAKKDESRFAGDAYRFTAYEAVEKKMKELDRG